MSSGLVALVARRLGVSPEALERDALILWLRRRLALIEAEVASILSRYGVRGPGELEEAVRGGRVPEHPAWEDLIVLQRLLDEKRRVEELLRDLEGSSGARS